MKKLSLFIITLFAAVLLVGCGGGKTVGPAKPKKIQLTYADWGNAEDNQKLIDAFEKAHPNIKVLLREDIPGSGAEFTGGLLAQAQAGNLPDVFATDNVPVVVNNGLTLDVAKYWDADEDAKLVYSFPANTAVYNGKRYAIPSFQFLKGIFINLTVFEKANLKTVPGKYRIDANGYPVKDWTHTEMVEIAKAITNYDLDDKANMMVGLGLWYGNVDFQQIWPMMNNISYAYDTYDGDKFHYESPEWIAAMKAKVDIMDNVKYPGVTSSIPADDLEKFNALELGWMITTGYQAMQIDGSWNTTGIMQGAEAAGFEIGFWPYPQGSEGFFPPTILDYQAISSQTKYPEEAYQLAKWMTYGKAGWLARLDIQEAKRKENLEKGEPIFHLDRYPIADYPEVWERVYNLLKDENGEELVPGLTYTLDHIEESRPDLDKWLAGYNTFWGWVADPENPYNWDNLLQAGPDAVATYAKEWNTKINQTVKDEIENLGKDKTN